MALRKYYIFAGLSLPLYLWAFFSQTNVPILPADFETATLSYPVVVEGIGAGTEAELRFIVEGWSAGKVVEIVPAGGESQLVRLVRDDTVSYWATTLASVIFFWLIAAFVLAPRCDQQAAKYFFWMTLVYGLGIAVGGVYFDSEPGSVRTVFNLLQLMVLAFLPPIFLGLTQIFPRELPIRQRLKGLMPTLWVIAIVLVVWQFIADLRYFLDPGPEQAARQSLSGKVADLMLILQAVAGIGLLIAQLWGLELTRERQQAKWVLAGFMVGALPYVFVRNLMLLIGLDAPLDHHVDRIFELAIPFAFGMAIARYRFLNIDIIIRRGLIYGLLAGVMTALFLVLGYGIGLVVPDLQGPLQWVHLIITGVVGGLAFPYLWRGIGYWVDRTFFHITYDQRRALVSLRRRLEVIADRENLVRLLSTQLDRTLTPRVFGVVVGTGPDQRVAGDADPFQIRRWWDICQEAQLGPGLVGSPGSTSLPEYERSDFPGALREDGIVLVQTIMQGGTCTGAIMCGPRSTDRRYVQQDLELLEAFATETVEALARIVLVKAVMSEGMERQRLDELNSLKNEFLAQVAHDLRTPLSSVTWSAANLRDGLAGALNDGQIRYVDSVSSAAAHLNRLVENLIEISQLDSGEIRFDSCELDLAAVIADAVRTMEPVAEAKDVIVVMAGEGAQVLANEDKLAVVLVNLLDNAVKYSPPGGRVEVGLSASAMGQVEFTVRDHGPGFGETRELFRRFAQGAPSPYSAQRGFGLGLFIVKNYLDRLGGTVAAEDHPDGGALVHCTLPGTN